MKLMFVARAVDGMAGGVERMVIAVMNAFAARGHTVELFTWDSESAEGFYPMAPGIVWHRLGIGDPKVRSGYAQKVQRGVAVRRLMRRRRPDAIVCFQEGPFIAIRAYTAGMGIPVIAAERNAPTRFAHTSGGPRELLVYTAFRFAHRILIQCESYRDHYPDYLRKKIITIPNPVERAARLALPAVPDSNGRFRLLSVGRLSYQKNYQALIHAFAAVADLHPEWDLAIVGEGEDRAALEKSVADKVLQHRISLPGVSKQVSDWYASSHLFCLPSRWEGFPNALAEACAHGLPAVGYSGCAGVSDLIEPGSNGLLADGNGGVHTLAAVLDRLMGDNEQRKRMGAAAVRSMEQFAPEHSFALWERTLSELRG